MKRILKKSLIFSFVIVSLAGSLIFLFVEDCYKKSVKAKFFIDKINKGSYNKYAVYLDNCYSELHIINQSNQVDSALFHRFLVGLIRIENRMHHLNVYSKDSMLLYVEYLSVNRTCDTVRHYVSHYEY